MPFCAARGKVSIHNTIIVAEIKRRAYKQSESKNGACFVASRDNNRARNHSFCWNLLSMSLNLQTQDDG